MIVVSGRPMEIDPSQLRSIDALAAAWLPGSAGVADPLLGHDPLYPFGSGLRTW